MGSQRAARDEPFALARWGVFLLTVVWTSLTRHRAVAPGSGWLVIVMVWLGTLVAVGPRRGTVSGGERRSGPFRVRDPKRPANGDRFTLADGGGIFL